MKVYNTLTKTKEEFVPVTPGKVGIYLCGPTVYKPSHIGHMVGPVIFDTIKRYLAYCGFDVTLVINITDVDDKLIAEAQARGDDMATVAEEMTADYKANLAAMGVLENVNHFPKATEHIGNIIRFVEGLIAKDIAYESGGDVYFDVGKFDEYGKLSHRSLKEMQGEGGGTASRKRTPYDFALWKSAKPGEPSWDSPWGKGRPGWHIECSVMSKEILGETFDIHGGGLDLVFPHHENEVAQSEALHGCAMAKYWLHNGLMQASSEVGKVGGRNTRAAAEGDLESQEAGKISKSKGSSAFRDLLKQFPAEKIRFFLISSHYRRPIDFSMERIEDVGKGLEAFYRFFKRYDEVYYAEDGQGFYAIPVTKKRGSGERVPSYELDAQVDKLREKFLEAMDDDFNTGAAVGVLFDLLRLLNKHIDENIELFKNRQAIDDGELHYGAMVLRELGATLGLFLEAPPEEATDDPELAAKLKELLDDLGSRYDIEISVDLLMGLLIQLRADAKKAKDFPRADEIRNRLKDIGVALEDKPGGKTDWSRG